MSGIASLLLGESPAIRRIRDLIARIGPTNLPVLIQGPTGCGKELVALAVHLASGRRGEFVPFNVCAIADSMFEDALFGHLRGAFTGATHDVRGLLAQADRGTCFFDEISGLSTGLQAKLLRAIETRRFRPVGSRSDTGSDFRVVAASNEDVASLVQQGLFRDDLLHRFGKVVIRVPPLVARTEDIPLLTSRFLRECSELPRQISAAAVQRLQAYHWPGNVRELRSVVETAAHLSERETLGVEDVLPLLQQSGEREMRRPRSDFVLRRTLAAVEEAEGNVYAAASILGVNPTTVYRRLRRAANAPRPPEPLVAAGGASAAPPGATKRHSDGASDRQASA
jgi:DNA-binding NtrC family response regulator